MKFLERIKLTFLIDGIEHYSFFFYYYFFLFQKPVTSTYISKDVTDTLETQTKFGA